MVRGDGECATNGNTEGKFLFLLYKAYVGDTDYYRTVSIIVSDKSGYQKNSLPYYVSFFLIFFIKEYVVGTHLNCINKLMQFKWVSTTYAFIKK